MNKQEFLCTYRRWENPRITIWFNEQEFCERTDVDLRSATALVSQIGEYFCPWHYNSSGSQIGSIEQAVGDTTAVTYQVDKADSFSIDAARQATIDHFIKNPPIYDVPIPIAIDSETRKVLILDANKRCIAAYRNYLQNQQDDSIPVIQIVGDRMVEIIEDFKVINRQNN